MPAVSPRPPLEQIWGGMPQVRHFLEHSFPKYFRSEVSGKVPQARNHSGFSATQQGTAMLSFTRYSLQLGHGLFLGEPSRGAVVSLYFFLYSLEFS